MTIVAKRTREERPSSENYPDIPYGIQEEIHDFFKRKSFSSRLFLDEMQRYSSKPEYIRIKCKTGQTLSFVRIKQAINFVGDGGKSCLALTGNGEVIQIRPGWRSVRQLPFISKICNSDIGKTDFEKLVLNTLDYKFYSQKLVEDLAEHSPVGKFSFDLLQIGIGQDRSWKNAEEMMKSFITRGMVEKANTFFDETRLVRALLSGNEYLNISVVSLLDLEITWPRYRSGPDFFTRALDNHMSKYSLYEIADLATWEPLQISVHDLLIEHFVGEEL